MITAWAMKAVSALMVVLIRSSPAPALPDVIASVGADITNFCSYMVSMSTWLPVAEAVECFLFLVSVMVLAWVIRGFRIAVSFLSFGGGS